MLRIFTDFSGPLIDISDRHYHVYKYCVSKCKKSDQLVKFLSKEDFWQLKKARVNQEKIAILSGLQQDQAELFMEQYKKNINNFHYMAYDKPIIGVEEALKTAKKANIDLVLITMRRVKELEFAFNSYNLKQLKQFFPEHQIYCVSDDYIKTHDIEDKPLLLEKALAELTPVSDTWMIGDTEADIIAAKRYNLKSVAVLSGSRNYTQLDIYKPYIIVNDILEAINFIIYGGMALR
ncbi:HAD family hydrolase [Anabaena sp. CCY 0017]|uniref:HAD family hydrolase n=1 Tax=Anabaena sp. CCY 0017 TaxID=3103866 RepID=UPI0039C62063